MVLRKLGALSLGKVSATHLRHLFSQRRRRWSSNLYDGELRTSEPWIPVDVAATSNGQHTIVLGRENSQTQDQGGYDAPHDGSGLKQHNIEGVPLGFLQQHDSSDCFRCTTPQQSHFQPFPQLLDLSDTVVPMPQLHKQHENHISICQKQDFTDGPTLSPIGLPDRTVQLRLDSSKPWQQSKRPAQLWDERQEFLSSFSSRYSAHLTKGQGDDFSFKNEQSVLLLSLCREGRLDKAIDVLFCMDAAPPTSDYLYFLSECSKNKAHIQATKVFAHFDHHHSSFAELIAELLVLKVSNGSATQSKQRATLPLPWLSDFAWSAMISSLVGHGHMKEAFILTQRMLVNGAEPSSYIFVSLIKACSIINDLFHGMKLHAAAFMKGFASHLVVGSTLVSMYGKCGAILEAETVFNTLCCHDVVSCNAMLAAFVDVGRGDRALLLYRQMHAQGIRANHGTFVVALQACRCIAEVEEAQYVGERSLRLVSLEIGQALHSVIRREGFAVDAFINNTLVNMYGKIGAIVEAEVVFDTFSNRDTISWNAMLSTYVENNQGKKALWLYKMMLQEDVGVVPLTYVFALQACEIIAEDEQAVVVEGKTVKVQSLRLGKALNLDACSMGFASDVFLGTALISMYGKCGAMVEAEDVFLSLTERDIVSWNALLSTYIEQEQGDKALQLFRQMQEDSVGANPQTLVFALQACAILADTVEAAVVKGRPVKEMALEIGQALHVFARRKCFTNSYVCNTLVSMYGNSGSLDEAEHLFVALLHPDVVSWNAMLSVYVEQGQGVPALQLYCQMQKKGTAPNNLTCLFALQACTILAQNERAVSVEGMLKKVVSLEIGSALHKDVLAKGFTSDAFVGNTLLSMYGKCGDVSERNNMFTSNLHRDIVSWNAMLSMCVEQGKADQALHLYKEIGEENIISDDATVISILQACSITGSLFMCEEVFFSVVSAGYDQSPSIAATLLYAYGSCARVADMEVCFDELVNCDAVSWNAFIAGHLGEEHIASTIHLYEEMKQSGIDPDEVTFILVLSACSHFGLVVDGFEYFKYMSHYYEICPNLRHYGAVVDLFGRAGDLVRAQNLLEGMPWEPDLSIALCLLGASQTHCNLELAEWAFSHAVRMQPKQSTAYVVMSNIYAVTRPFG
ncbi:hypothetical protein GOP47_0003523 [Adiantum capillus-veneris]|uniref:Pentatricopeptide repeat-containing protein n=1 Tax=Adiantum capillus-veneris TaxID=13818 RepID=A0A9D4VCZ8_ADICA|nr:hypothetical protein GOP47_0003523 [Adiantum capillus-veneris]